MVVENIKSGKKFTTTKQEWEKIISDGNAYKYKTLDKGEPIEVKSMRSEKETKLKK